MANSHERMDLPARITRFNKFERRDDASSHKLANNATKFFVHSAHSPYYTLGILKSTRWAIPLQYLRSAKCKQLACAVTALLPISYIKVWLIGATFSAAYQPTAERDH